MKSPEEFYQDSNLNLDDRKAIYHFTKLYSQYYYEEILKGNHNTVVVSGFPGIGKTTYFNNDYMPQGFCLDSDSSKFDKCNFPKNYIEHIKSNLGKVKYIFVSSHKDVRNALYENDIEFVLVYPALFLKEEYLVRYKERGSDEKFISLLSDNWDSWLKELRNQKGCKHIILQKDQFLSNVQFD